MIIATKALIIRTLCNVCSSNASLFSSILSLLPSFVQVFTGVPVIRIVTHTDELGVRRVTAVETPAGTIRTRCVVNASGAWAPTVARTCAVHVPLQAMRFLLSAFWKHCLLHYKN